MHGFKIKKCVAVITGASSGIGRATALRLAKGKAALVLTARSESSLREVAEECERLGGRAISVPADVRDEQAMKDVASKAIERFGRLDVWINNAAVTLFGRVEEVPSETFRRVLETNFFGYVNGARAALPHFRAQERGILINVSSQVGRVGSPYLSAYVASKFAVNGFAESLRMEVEDAPDIHVCSVLAASIDTPFFQHAANYTGRAVKPLEPIYTPETVAETIEKTIGHPKREVIAGTAAGAMVLARYIAPGMAEKGVAKQVDQNHFQDRPALPTDGNLFGPMESWNAVHGGWGQPAESRSHSKAGLGLAALGAGVAYLVWKRKSNGRSEPEISLEEQRRRTEAVTPDVPPLQPRF
jgi:short-subunit dehydrogenase